MFFLGAKLDRASLQDLSREDLIELLQDRAEGGINLSFTGKANARRMARQVRPRVTRNQQRISCGDAEQQARNLLLEGDNLQAMVTLYRERGHVDLILTDPPYNTGNDFRYNDKWDEDPNDPGLGDLVSADDGARHTKWMKFMWPRLQMMRSLLKPNGVLAICIDHRELFRLGQMLDELFGEHNRLAIINWEKSYSPRNQKAHVSTATEYVLVYAKDSDLTKTGLLSRTEVMDARYRSRDNDPLDWKSADASAPGSTTHPGMVYAIQSPFTGELYYPPEGRHWAAERKTMKQWLEQWGSSYRDKSLDDGRPPALVLKGSLEDAAAKAQEILDRGPWPQLYFGLTGKTGPQQKKYLERVKKGFVPVTYWASDEYDLPEVLEAVSWDHEQSGHSQTGINELDAVVGKGHGFETVKPLKLFTKIIQIWCPPDGLIVDPFAGSGTTGHAVFMGNQVEGVNRRFILIEQGRPEKGDSYAKTLTADRLQRVITGNWANGKGKPLGGGFRFVTLDKKVDAAALLQMERDEMVDTVIASHFDSTRRRGSGLISVPTTDNRYLLAKNIDGEGIFLVWSGAGKNTNFTEAVYEACSQEAERAGLKPHFHVYARLYLYQSEDVTFYQIPDRILADFGLNIRSERFHEADE